MKYFLVKFQDALLFFVQLQTFSIFWWKWIPTDGFFWALSENFQRKGESVNTIFLCQQNSLVLFVRTEILIDISKFLRCLGFSLIYNSISRSYFLISTKNRSVFRTQSNINDTVSSYISEGNFPSSKKKKKHSEKIS